MTTRLGGERVDTCPLYLVYKNPGAFNRLLRIYRYAEKGILPEPGALEDQAAPLISALSYVSMATDEVQRVLMKRTSRTPDNEGDGGET